MISLVDNNAPRELIASVKDDLFPKPIALRYRDRHELVSRLDDEKYRWVKCLTKDDPAD